MASESGLRRVRVSAPATSANLGPGFDAMGVALARRGTVELARDDRPDAGPTVGQRMALEAVERVYASLGRKAPVLRITIDSDIPAGRGLGASAMLRAASALAATALAGVATDLDALLGQVADLEGHADNAAPALLGGFQVVVREGERWLHLRLSAPAGLHAAAFVPDFEMSTDESRRLLPASLTRAEVVQNTGRVALLVGALTTGRFEMLRTATQDVLHQPARAKLFPAMYDIFTAATDAGACGAYLSGGGSTILALVNGNAERIAAAMASAAAAAGVTGSTFCTSFSELGAEIDEQE